MKKTSFIKNIETRIIGILAIISSLIYTWWVLTTFNHNTLIGKIVITLLLTVSTISVFWTVISIINNWNWSIPVRKSLKKGLEPYVGIIIPTWSEPDWMVKNTVLSVLNQEYPRNKMIVIVSDDSANPEMSHMVHSLSKQFPDTSILYNLPPSKQSVDRKGEGKAGNLNSVLEILNQISGVKYIETRDADDLVVDPYFLQETIAQLEADPKLAYVQTIKKVQHSKGDPFANSESLFYNSLMLSRNSTNSVIPCGSGLVWRKEALIDIDGFPTWNMVEDFQSGIEAVKKGWKSMYIPIVGALGQVCPEDIPNLYKQRGTWALDAFRFAFYGDKRGLSFIQLLHFMEAPFWYLFSCISFIFPLIPIVTILGEYNVSNQLHPFESFVFTFTPVLSGYLFVASLTRREKIEFKNIFDSYRLILNMFPVYIKALFLSIFYGPNRKPKYVVTRKSHKHGIYLNMVIPQIIIEYVLVITLIMSVLDTENFISGNWVTSMWLVFHIVTYSKIIRNSWYKFSIKDTIVGFLKRLKLIEVTTPNVKPKEF